LRKNEKGEREKKEVRRGLVFFPFFVTIRQGEKVGGGGGKLTRKKEKKIDGVRREGGGHEAGKSRLG